VGSRVRHRRHPLTATPPGTGEPDGPVGYRPDPQRFRQALGHFATGVTVIAGVDGAEPVGFACQAFAALSLDPPLVLCCPARSSASWPRLARSGRFCANVLAAGQRELARRFGVSGPDKFSGISWSPDPCGLPVLAGVLTWASCEVETVSEAGDHYVVIGRVLRLGDIAAGEPLLFYRGRFTLSATADGSSPPEAVDTLLAWPQFADWM
jgi:3-hydroxy-9,10-secoandrosta-1,3,5(10)-triene-9,17-dione monooxygenase reductase component